ncbi:MAG: hypothetical protein M1833_003940 [Piccolia ochrophora]|nr:MAG: hypothetical protein M1833_003940 [Piccolia ochrophora]
MLHGPFSHYTTNFQLNIPKCLEKGSKYVLGFNEPDWPTPDGLNPYVDPATAAQNFRDMITPHSEQLSIGAPAVTSSVLEGKGVKWLRPFLEACKDCKIDFVPIHWYGEPGQGDAFLPHVDEVRELTRELLGEEVPLWITEFQLKGNDQQQADFLNLVLPELEKRDFVARYSYFFVDQSLAGGPTADPGKAYVA